jgi:hypothetical protein
MRSYVVGRHPKGEWKNPCNILIYLASFVLFVDGLQFLGLSVIELLGPTLFEFIGFFIAYRSAGLARHVLLHAEKLVAFPPHFFEHLRVLMQYFPFDSWGHLMPNGPNGKISDSS